MIVEQPLFQSTPVVVSRYVHPLDQAHHDPAEEVSASNAVSFIERGGFELFEGRRRWRLDPATLFVTRPGLTYRCAHDDERPDDVCLALHFAPEYFAEVAASATGAAGARRAPGSGRRRSGGMPPVVRRTDRLAYLNFRLTAALRGQEAATAVPVIAGEVLAEVVAGAGSGTGPATASFSDGHIARYARRVDAARALYASHYSEPLTLDGVAGEVGMSPFHFSRVFRALVGLPPHRYLRGVRLERAAERLRAGAGVTDTCHATGFNNLGHFIRAFRAAYGVTPSRYPSRACPAPARRSKKPQAAAAGVG